MSAPHRDASVSVHVVRRDGDAETRDRDSLTAEEPLEIRLREGTDAPERFVVTMRTPGDDDDLAVGLLYGEGVISGIGDVAAVGPPGEPGLAPELARNVRVVTLAPGAARCAPRRATVMGSACGVCGRTSVSDVIALAEAARARAARPAGAGGAADLTITAELLTRLPGVLREKQSVFASTGGLHAAGFFEADGTLVVAREDVGRHNATDKAVGALLREGRRTPPILLVSGRLGFEIAQKAALAGARIVAAVSAPTSLAVELAEEAGLTVVGFLRGARFNVYAHPERIRG
ncbi:MAG: formate dehydrogenase accessory sulfurtransferase FdhD [Acidobacteria bacterium]|nr:formate dehydrogenase accessory sulfurtransferase FdhD [Acidobacteriota bacterium]